MCCAVVRALAIARFWDGFPAARGWADASRSSTAGRFAVVVQVVVVASIAVVPVVVVVVVVEVGPGLVAQGPGLAVAWRPVANAAAGADRCAMWSFVAMPSLWWVQSVRARWLPHAFGPAVVVPSGSELPR